MLFKKSLVFVLFILLMHLAFAGPTISSSTHPDPDKWYKSNSPSFQIETSGTGYSYKLDLNPDTIPPEEVTSNESTKSYSNRTGGVQYFHARVKSGGEWSDTTHFKLMIDSTKPRNPTNLKATPLENGNIEITWENGEDLESGISGHKILRSFLRDFDILFDFHETITEKAVGTSFIDDTTSEGKNYHYRLQAIDKVGNVGGLTRSFFANVPTTCDFVPSIETTLDDDTLSIVIDSSPYIMNFATLVLKPVSDDEIEIFSSQSGQDLFSETADLSDLVDQEILIDFNVRDESGDACDTEKTFYLDRVKPTGEWVYPAEGDVLVETVTLNVNAVDEGQSPSGVSLVKFFYDDSGLIKIGETAVSDNGDFIFEWDSLGAPNGRHSFVAKIFDLGGNFFETSVNVIIKNTALIRADTNSVIQTAEEKKVDALEMQELIKTLGVESEEFNILMENADSNLLRAKDVFEVGINFERAKTDATVARGLYEGAASFFAIEKDESFLNVFTVEEIKSGFKKAGLAEKFVSQATESLELFSPARRADLYKVVDGNVTFYKLVFILSITGVDFNGSDVQLIEVIPKDFDVGIGDIRSSSEFEILNSGPVIKFNLDLEKSKKVSYSLAKNYSKIEAKDLTRENPLKLFESLPIVLSSDTKIDSSTVVRPFDLFEIIDPITSEYDTFTLALVSTGVLAVIIVILGIVSFFIVLLAVLKSR